MTDGDAPAPRNAAAAIDRFRRARGWTVPQLADAMVAHWPEDVLPPQNPRGMVQNVLEGGSPRQPEFWAAVARALRVEPWEIRPVGRARRHRFGVGEFDFDERRAGLYRIMKWNALHQLEAVTTSTVAPTAGARPWGLRDGPADVEPSGTPCPTLRAWQVDDQESSASDALRLQVSASSTDAAEATVRRLDASRTVLLDAHRSARVDGLAATVASGPPGRIAVHLTLTDRDDRVLLVRRPGRVRAEGRAVWTAGVEGTLGWRADADDGAMEAESPFATAERILAGIGPAADTWSPVRFSWFGFRLDDATACFVGQVRSTLSARTIAAHLRPHKAAAWAGDGTRWMPLIWQDIEDEVVATARGEVTPTSREHSAVSVLACTEAWRMRPTAPSSA